MQIQKLAGGKKNPRLFLDVVSHNIHHQCVSCRFRATTRAAYTTFPVWWCDWKQRHSFGPQKTPLMSDFVLMGLRKPFVNL